MMGTSQGDECKKDDKSFDLCHTLLFYMRFEETPPMPPFRFYVPMVCKCKAYNYSD